MAHNEQPLIIVTGAGRSGTSAVARVLHESGVLMGRSMAAASEANPEGFYEDLDVVELNERILTDIGMNDPWRPERWPARASVIEAGEAYRAEMRALAKTGVSGWKDPRFSTTLEAWLRAVLMKPKVIVCLRSPQAYADSATRIYGLVKPARAMREWARHYRRLLAVIRQHRLESMCVEYDALVEQPQETVEALSRFVGRELDASYVVPRLRREGGLVPEEYHLLYERVASLGGRPRAQVVRTAERSVPEKRPATDGYERLASGVVERVRVARTLWASRVAMPELTANDETRTACAAYDAALIEGQEAIAALRPPEDLDQEHTLVARRINEQRMVAALALAAVSTGDGRTREVAQRVWKRFGHRTS